MSLASPQPPILSIPRTRRDAVRGERPPIFSLPPQAPPIFSLPTPPQFPFSAKIQFPYKTVRVNGVSAGKCVQKMKTYPEHLQKDILKYIIFENDRDQDEFNAALEDFHN